MADLIFDIGMHNGDDTAYYLASGYDVVAVEANPEFCAAARERSAAEIAAGRLTICNVGIAEQAGELEFWVSGRSEWSSFHKEMATGARRLREYSSTRPGTRRRRSRRVVRHPPWC